MELCRSHLPMGFIYTTADAWSFGANGYSDPDENYIRDYFSFVTANRIADALSTKDGGVGAVQYRPYSTTAKRNETTVNMGIASELRTAAEKLSATPLVWSQTRLHMQKAWLATTSEMVSDFDRGVGAANSTDDYKAARKYSHETTLSTGSSGSLALNTRFPLAHDVNYTDPNKDLYDVSWANDLKHWQYAADPQIEFGQYEDALELGQEYTSQLTAYNYGDRNLDGVEFTYIMPRGVEPVLNDDGTVKLDAELLSKVNGISKGIGADNDGAPYVNETYAAIPDEIGRAHV